MSFDDIDMSIPKGLKKKRVNKRMPELESILFTGCSEATKEWARTLIQNHWTFVVADTANGSWSWNQTRTITIGRRHCESLRPGYKEYIICHEMAHAFNKDADSHGPKFMEWLKRICPQEFIHYELEYKPRNATAAGIGVVKTDADDLGF